MGFFFFSTSSSTCGALVSLLSPCRVAESILSELVQTSHGKLTRSSNFLAPCNLSFGVVFVWAGSSLIHVSVSRWTFFSQVKQTYPYSTFPPPPHIWVCIERGQQTHSFLPATFKIHERNVL